MNKYRTNEIARIIGVHPNTVRFYEEMGFITPPQRLANGYRVYTELHLRQMELARLALRAEVLQNGLRKKVVEAVRFCAALDFDSAEKAALEYEAMIAREIENVKAAIISAETMVNGKQGPDGTPLKRLEAAVKLNVTVDTLRNWELNGLITVKRRQNGYRIYHTADLERLSIIRTLRCANHSLSAILRLMNHLDRNQSVPVAKILNTPAEDEGIISVCDQLIVSLENTREDSKNLQILLEDIKQIFQCLS